MTDALREFGDRLKGLFGSDGNNYDVAVGFGTDEQEAIDDAIDNAPDYVEDETDIDQGYDVTLTDLDDDMAAALDGQDEVKAVGVEYKVQDTESRSRKQSGGGAAYDETYDEDGLTDLDKLR
ncbi:MAG: hypothetical protein SV186_04720 [Candidatus Nanohaloarchaea archaeon]|nr:hypothetical protein [Candidatus Nanohaloarchaea archaeon]